MVKSVLTPEQLVGLAEVLPAGYPKTSGVVVMTDTNGRSKSSRKGRDKKVYVHIPWYRRGDGY